MCVCVTHLLPLLIHTHTHARTHTHTGRSHTAQAKKTDATLNDSAKVDLEGGEGGG